MTKKRKRRTHEEYVLELNEINPNIEVVDTFINTVTKIKHRCKIDGHEWMVRPHDILRGRGCPVCGKQKFGQQHIKQNYQIGQRICDSQRDITIIDVEHTYKDNNCKHKIWKYKYRCNKCGFDCGLHYKDGIEFKEYWTTQDNLNQGKGCACCFNRVIAPEINSIFANSDKYGWMVEYFESIEDSKKYSANYSKKILLRCPDCKRYKKISPHTLCRYGFGCVCGDGFSYPEKFLYNILEQLCIDFEWHKTFDWSKNTKQGTKIYDFYLKKYNMIIETHGLQHYEEAMQSFKLLQEEQENDLFKKELALSNNIQYYVVLNCSESDCNFIYKSIVESILPSIFNIKNIDIKKANKFATNNLVKYCAELWNIGKTTREISDITHIHTSTVRRYLQKAEQLEWCKYKKTIQN